jgi:hypothetical protein
VGDGSLARGEDVRCLYCGGPAETGLLRGNGGWIGWVPDGANAWWTSRKQLLFLGLNAIARRGRGEGPLQLRGCRCEHCRLVWVRY